MNIIRQISAFLFVLIGISGCSQDFGPGYKFELFKNTPNWKLAKAVEDEDIAEIKFLLRSDTSIKINMREPVYGNTLLNLAVGNDKLKAVKVLLDEKADFSIVDTFGLAPLHEALSNIKSRKHSLEIVKTLLEHGANPNLIALINSKKTKYVPLMYAVESLEATKLLLNYGADVYFKDSLEYPVWTHMLIDDSNSSESIYVIRYLVVERGMTIPNPIFYVVPDNSPRDFNSLLERYNIHDDAKKQKAKLEILNYLKVQ